MKKFVGEPGWQYMYFILATLFFIFTGGAPAPSIEIDKYSIPAETCGFNCVYNDSGQIIFNGTLNATGLDSSWSVSQGQIAFAVSLREENPTKFIALCYPNFGSCTDYSDSECYCNKKDGDIYSFVINTTSDIARSEAFIRGEWRTYVGESQQFPKIIDSSNTPTTDSTGTSTGSTDVTNVNVTFSTVTTGGSSNDTGGQKASDDGCCDSIWIIVGSVGGFVVIAFVVILIYVCWWKKKKCAAVTSNQPSDSPAEEVSTVHSTNHNTLTSSKPEDKDKVEMTEEKKKKKSKKSTKAGSPKKKKKDFENGEKKMDENEPRCLPQPEPVAEPGLSTSLSNPEALKSNFATTRLSSPPSNTRPTSIEMTSAPRPLPSPRNPNM